ncbi:MAG: U32 family peptidase [Clostridia bacterium]|nr:U32 family peptidase [Clostridia bacterium]
MIELLSPAGNFEKMKTAFLYGADAVYLAYNRFGMRAAADNFTLEELNEAIGYAHSLGKKIYITLNTMPREYEYPALREFLKELAALENGAPDAAIVADIGVMMMVRELLPKTELHISTQSGVVSSADAKAWQMLGATRVVLARELSFDEIREIRKNIPAELEIEAFIHGSMCVSFSGRCLLSNALVGRDANRGACAQPCRWNYTIREEKRPDMPFPIEEHPDGTFIMSSKDMCMLEHVPELVESGITSFKIEGRMKSAYYAAVVTNAYRAAIDAYLADKEHYTLDERWLRELDSVSHREYCTGYYYDKPMENAQICTQTGYLREKSYLAVCVDYDAETGIAKFIQRNKAKVGDDVEIITPGKFGRAMRIPSMKNADGESVESAPHPFMEFYVPVPFALRKGDIMRGAN